MTYTTEQLQILKDLCETLETVINDSPTGVPAGPLYMALSQAGMTLDQFEKLMSALVMCGKIRKSGHQYFPMKRKEV
jgi:hypothetical protein